MRFIESFWGRLYLYFMLKWLVENAVDDIAVQVLCAKPEGCVNVNCSSVSLGFPSLRGLRQCIVQPPALTPRNVMTIMYPWSPQMNQYVAPHFPNFTVPRFISSDSVGKTGSWPLALFKSIQKEVQHFRQNDYVLKRDSSVLNIFSLQLSFILPSFFVVLLGNFQIATCLFSL